MSDTWDIEIELGKMAETKISGEVIKEPVYRTVYANKKSIKQSEFYQAENIGLKPELVFIIHKFEYDDDEKVRYNSVEYSIIRTYENGHFIELTVSAHVGSGT